MLHEQLEDMKLLERQLYSSKINKHQNDVVISKVWSIFQDYLTLFYVNIFLGKRLVSIEAMVSKIRAALAARSEPDFFIIARTDAIEAYGLDEALRRGERYLHAGADGLFIEGPRSIEQIERIGRHFKGASLCVNIFEGGGRTPWVSPEDLHKMGFSMILYPTTILFSVTYAIEQAAKNLNAGKQLSSKDSVDFKTYEDIVGLPQWEEIEKKFHHEEQ